jgi:hypothetical protein
VCWFYNALYDYNGLYNALYNVLYNVPPSQLLASVFGPRYPILYEGWSAARSALFSGDISGSRSLFSAVLTPLDSSHALLLPAAAVVSAEEEKEEEEEEEE